MTTIIPNKDGNPSIKQPATFGKFKRTLTGSSFAMLAMTPLALGLIGCPGGRSQSKPNISVQTLKQEVSVTAGHKVQLEAKVLGADKNDTKKLTWIVLGANGGTVSATGLYTAPAAIGTYQVEARVTGVPGATDRIKVKVIAAPEALELKVAPDQQITLGQHVTLTPHFTGGVAKIEPGSVQVEDGKPYDFTALNDTVYKLIVTNELGVVAEVTAPIKVFGSSPQTKGIQVAGPARVGANQVAWAEVPEGENLDWTVHEAGIARHLGRGSKVVFAPRVTGFELVATPVSLAGGPAQGGAPRRGELRFHGTVDAPATDGQAPQFDLQPKLTAGDQIKIQVTDPKPGIAYEWALRNDGATFEGSGKSAKGREVTLNVGHGPALYVDCVAIEESTLSEISRIRQVAGIYQPAEQPKVKLVTKVDGAGRLSAQVESGKPGVEYVWELREGRFHGGDKPRPDPRFSEGSRVEFEVPAEQIELTCWAINAAGVRSAPLQLSSPVEAATPASDPAPDSTPAPVLGLGSGEANPEAPFRPEGAPDAWREPKRPNRPFSGTVGGSATPTPSQGRPLPLNLDLDLLSPATSATPIIPGNVPAQQPAQGQPDMPTLTRVEAPDAEGWFTLSVAATKEEELYSWRVQGGRFKDKGGSQSSGNIEWMTVGESAQVKMLGDVVTVSCRAITSQGISAPAEVRIEASRPAAPVSVSDPAAAAGDPFPANREDSSEDGGSQASSSPRSERRHSDGWIPFNAGGSGLASGDDESPRSLPVPVAIRLSPLDTPSVNPDVLFGRSPLPLSLNSPSAPTLPQTASGSGRRSGESRIQVKPATPAITNLHYSADENNGSAEAHSEVPAARYGWKLKWGRKDSSNQVIRRLPGQRLTFSFSPLYDFVDLSVYAYNQDNVVSDFSREVRVWRTASGPDETKGGAPEPESPRRFSGEPAGSDFKPVPAMDQPKPQAGSALASIPTIFQPEGSPTAEAAQDRSERPEIGDIQKLDEKGTCSIRVLDPQLDLTYQWQLEGGRFNHSGDPQKFEGPRVEFNVPGDEAVLICHSVNAQGVLSNPTKVRVRRKQKASELPGNSAALAEPGTPRRPLPLDVDSSMSALGLASSHPKESELSPLRRATTPSPTMGLARPTEPVSPRSVHNSPVGTGIISAPPMGQPTAQTGSALALVPAVAIPASLGGDSRRPSAELAALVRPKEPKVRLGGVDAGGSRSAEVRSIRAEDRDLKYVWHVIRGTFKAGDTFRQETTIQIEMGPEVRYKEPAGLYSLTCQAVNAAGVSSEPIVKNLGGDHRADEKAAIQEPLNVVPFAPAMDADREAASRTPKAADEKSPVREEKGGAGQSSTVVAAAGSAASGQAQSEQEPEAGKKKRLNQSARARLKKKQAATLLHHPVPALDLSGSLDAPLPDGPFVPTEVARIERKEDRVNAQESKAAQEPGSGVISKTRQEKQKDRKKQNKKKRTLAAKEAQRLRQDQGAGQ